MALASILSISVFLFKHPAYIDVQGILKEIDYELLQFKVRISYETCFWITVKYSFLMWLPFAAIISGNKPVEKRILDVFGYGYPIMIRFVVIYMYALVLMYVWQKLWWLNKVLENMNAEDAPKVRSQGRFEAYPKRSAKYVIVKVTLIHEKIVKAMNECTSNYSMILLFNIAVNYVQFVFGIFDAYVGTFGEFTIFENFLATFALNMQMTYVYLLAFYVKQMVSRFSIAQFLTCWEKLFWTCSHVFPKYFPILLHLAVYNVLQNTKFNLNSFRFKSLFLY